MAPRKGVRPRIQCGVCLGDVKKEALECIEDI
jgi:hypothetical protein